MLIKKKGGKWSGDILIYAMGGKGKEIKTVGVITYKSPFKIFLV